jgi:tripartite-type tricarboxylate transporter receptor subunit TctC
VFRSEPDGHTVLATPQGPLVICPSFVPKLGFDPAQFVPVTIMAKLPYILVVHPNVPVATFAEFIAYAKAHPGKLNIGSPGLGSSSHLTGEMLTLAAGIQMTHVPDAGLAPALTDLLAGHTDVMIANLDSSLSQVQEGKLKGLAVTSERRAPELPDLPAIAESYPEVVSTSWFAVVAPPKTPAEIAGKLSQSFAEILREPEVERKWREMSLTPVGGTPAEVEAFLKAETERWRHVIVSGGIKRQ